MRDAGIHRWAMPVALLALRLAGAAPAQEMVPFAIPMAATSPPATARAYVPIPPDAPPVRVRDGHFAWRGARVRIWGVNTCFEANFPSHAEAEAIAIRLAHVGVNSVRFHHMDTARFPHGILNPSDPLKLSPEACERLDYFIDQLARHGIWANLNLHVGRSASRALGLPDPGTDYDKIVGIFTPPLIAAQRQYARDLLTRTNRYRNVRYADDPAVAFVEITNEDSLFMWDAESRLRGQSPFYAEALRRCYAAWLKVRYGDTPALRRAWSPGAEPLGSNLLAAASFPEGDSPAGTVGWRLEQHAPSAARVVRPADRADTIRLEIVRDSGTAWHLQFKQTPLALQGGRYYTVSFRARADRPRRIGVSLMQDHDPWQTLGHSRTVGLTRDWQTVRDGFVVTGDDGHARLSFSVGGDTAAMELADVLLAPGGREGLAAGESIEAGTVAVFGAGETETRVRDRWRFLAETEKAYFDGMRDFLKRDLGVKALVTGTVVFGPCGLYGQSGMDYVDSHAYWQHPRFPGRPWDPGNWTVEQKAMVDAPADATLPRLSAERLAARPFTVSEYNHPAPNDFQAECVPLIAAWGAAQNWDGIWLFAYSHRSNDLTRASFSSFFDIDANPAKWGFMRAGAAIFRDETLAPLPALRIVNVADRHDPLSDLTGLHQRYDHDLLAVVAAKAGLKWDDLLTNRLALAWWLRERTPVEREGEPPVFSWAATNGWGLFGARGHGASVLVTHRRDGAPARGAGIEVIRPGFAAVAVTALDGKPLAESRRVLVTACGRCENTAMGFSSDRRTVGREWGRAPVLIEPVEGRVALPPGEWRAVALGPDGRRDAAIAVETDSAGVPSLRLAARHGTVWYLIER